LTTKPGRKFVLQLFLSAVPVVPPFQETIMADAKSSSKGDPKAGSSTAGAGGKSGKSSGKDAQSHTKASTGKGAGGGKKQQRSH
jgi:hypothetical protein